MIRIIQGHSVSYFRPDEALPTASLQEEVGPDRVLISLNGSFGNELALELGDELAALLSTGRSPVLCLHGATYLGSAVLEQLINIQNLADKARRSLVLTRLSPAVQAQLKRTGLLELLDISQEVTDL